MVESENVNQRSDWLKTKSALVLVASIKSLLNVMVLNARSIFNKVDELKALIDNYKSDTLFVMETWLTKSIPNEAVNISGFNVFRKERNVVYGGGIAIYIKRNILGKTRSDLNSSTVECLWMTIRPKWLPRKISRFASAVFMYHPLCHMRM